MKNYDNYIFNNKPQKILSQQAISKQKEDFFNYGIKKIDSFDKISKITCDPTYDNFFSRI